MVEVEISVGGGGVGSANEKEGVVGLRQDRRKSQGQWSLEWEHDSSDTDELSNSISCIDNSILANCQQSNLKIVFMDRKELRNSRRSLHK